jgi:S-DNA-T family DNA segregation ATPase FtsK/SpoIIIE
MAVTIVLLHGDSLYQRVIEPYQEVSFGSHKKDDVFVEGFLQSQIVFKMRNDVVSLKAQKVYNFDKDAVPYETFIILDNATRTAIYLSRLTVSSNQTIKLPYNCMLKFGRSANNDVIMKVPFVSGTHFILRVEGGNVRVEDNGSTNGIYVNGKRVKVARLKSGDTLSILSINIKLLNGVLYFENIGALLTINKIGSGSFANITSHAQGQVNHLKYRRSPRTQEKLPSEDIVLANAPMKGQKFEKSRGMLNSLVGTGVMFASSMLTTAASPALLAARAASLVSPVTSMASSSGANKRRKKSLEQYEAMRREKYGAYIDDQKARIETVAKTQRDILTRENPTPKECVDILNGLKRNLWERMYSDRDFLDVRLGMGYENLCVPVKARTDTGTVQMENDEARELCEQIIEETKIVDNVPARLPLLKYNTVGFVGNRDKTISLVKNMLVSLTTAHCFEDVRVVGLFDKEEEKTWEFMKWLPHIWDNNKQFRYLAFGEESSRGVCEVMNDILKQRKEALKESSYNKSVPSPYYIIIFGSSKIAEREEIMNSLFENTPCMGVSSLFLFNDMYLLPHDCKYIVDVDNEPCAYERNEANNKFYFTMDNRLPDTVVDSFARRMSAIELEGFTTEVGLPNSLTFLEGFGVETVEQLDVLHNWNSSKPQKSLAAPIGVLNGGKQFFFDIHEKGHGAHGLVAGTTGSGKSEVLITWILSMAVLYHPYDVNFVVIDYKGGGMANRLEALPHVVGKITNIGSNIGRSLASLEFENKRRQLLFEKYGVDNISKYQEMYKAGKIFEPMPHLVIVADEFAELKKNEPEFMAGLINVARVGRSLGVHLVLATQKPGGIVDDQITSNVSWSICLKVQNVNDSREMIKRPDAAKLTQAGRAYIRVGEDIYFDLFQSYWSGAPYFGGQNKGATTENMVRIVDISGRRIKTTSDRTKKMKSDVDEITAVIRYLNAIAAENNIHKLNGPWLPELPENLYLSDITGDIGFDGSEWNGQQKWLSVPIGMYDRPKTQEQGIQYLDFALEGHCGIYGAPGTGKTTMLKSIVMSLCMLYKPSDVSIYILDCGGWSMSAFSNMPHVGGVALDTEEEKFLKFEKLINEEFEARKKSFLKNAVSSLSAYREAVSDDMPAIIIAIDNMAPIFDLYPDFENLLVTIAREGATYGIYMIFTANSTSGVRYKIMQNIRGAIAFELTDKGDYSTLVGRLDGVTLSNVIGRAFFKGTPPVEFQAALYANGQTEREKTLSVQDISMQMNSAWDGPRPKPIPVMPETVSVEMMEAEYCSRYVIPFGIKYSDIRPATVDLSDNYSMVVAGSIGTGKSMLLGKTIQMVNNKFSDTKIFVFDSTRKSLSSFSNSAYKYTTSDNDESVSSMLAELIDYLNVRKRAQNQSRQIEGESFDEKRFIADYEMLCIVIDDLRDFIDAVSDANKNSMERICRLAQNLGVIVIAGGRSADLVKYNEFESLTRVIIGNQNGLAIDGTPAQHSYFQNKLKYNEKDIDAGEGNGYLFINSNTEKIRLI